MREAVRQSSVFSAPLPEKLPPTTGPSMSAWDGVGAYFDYERENPYPRDPTIYIRDESMTLGDRLDHALYEYKLAFWYLSLNEHVVDHVRDNLESRDPINVSFKALNEVGAPIALYAEAKSSQSANVGGGTVASGPPKLPGPYAEINEIKRLNVDEIRKGLRQGGNRVGPGEPFGLLTYDPDTGEVFYQIYENAPVFGQLGPEIHSELLGTVAVPGAPTPQVLGNLIEAPIRDLFAKTKNVSLVPKLSPSENGPDIVVAGSLK
jgi:hypothetical protein